MVDMEDQKFSSADIRDRARKLQAEAKRLLEMADALDELMGPVRNGRIHETGAFILPRRGRINEMIAMLKEEPLPAKEIVARMKVSRGAVYAWLKDRGLFESTPDGKWKLKDNPVTLSPRRKLTI